MLLVSLHGFVGGCTADELVGPFGFVRAVGHLVVVLVFIGVVCRGGTGLVSDDIEYFRGYGCGYSIAGMIIEALTVEETHGGCFLVLERMREELLMVE